MISSLLALLQWHTPWKLR